MGSLFIQKSAVSKKARFRVQSCIAPLYILRDISKLFWKLCSTHMYYRSNRFGRSGSIIGPLATAVQVEEA